MWTAITPAGQDALAAVASDPLRTLLAFDFDGTLAELQLDPEDSHLYDPTADAIDRLAPHVGRIAVITGRPADVVVRLGRLSGRPGFADAIVFGQYGVERWDAATGTLDSPPNPESVAAATADLAALLADEAAAGRDTRGINLEDKGRAVAVHVRQHADPGAAHARLESPVADIAGRHGLVLEPGRMVIELRSSHVTKGDALDALIAADDPRVVLVFGDDLGDIPAFEAAHAARNRGLTTVNVLAASAETKALTPLADIECDGPRGIAAFLNDLARKLDA